MSRFLFVSLPLTGHVNPMAAVAKTLTAQGHDVAWAGSESYLRPLVGPEAVIQQIPLRPHRRQADRGMAAAKTRWEEYIVPHCKVSLKGVDKAVQAFQPDVLAVDQHAVAGALAAHRYGLTWASMAPTTMELTRPYRSALPKVEAWIHGHLADLWTYAGLPDKPPHDLRFSPHLLIAFTGTALTGPLAWPDNAVLVGPSLAKRPADHDFPTDWLDPDRKHVLISMGTLAAETSHGFYERAVQAVRPLGIQAVVTAAPETIPDPPDHVLVRARVPVLELMPHLDAVVSHGGLNTVCESLAHGVPLVLAPIKGDQPINAAQVAAAGAGVRVSFARTRPEVLRESIESVLEDKAIRKAAARVRASFAVAGGAIAAAGQLALLANPPLGEKEREPLEGPA
ncbi:glycosyltransferase [Catenulispora sp. NF23]|uniref:Glycosyltransferase n=1 Tax=Catenulispora pinistramenti TaxID=2705254 RepID=A0ABS5L636_9ACTN|nr:nucleotide disphospho-sugar-binding domain-containing protein [Catenulispora pinistramenti]MBS2538286.1 glycosyltransferase [Catenulispora pinistramenti]MBS2553705.1 glycosyltransferase [Catenulispora pinistramenti]